MKLFYLAFLSLTLSGCVLMSKRQYFLLMYENRLLGRMEGISDCGEITFKKLAKPEPGSFEDLADRAAEETDRHFRKTEEKLGVTK